ncbi:MAG: NHLP family bacteriocin export ABC transporter permease/ATPase subunit, partial [Lachnospiraceae bacterium]|nr:NHLP family bacteriocin export ABC transporter permease/ATPase subunit [Lachnospiraceae bacterium]
MGWFDEQIKQRRQNDDNVFNDAFVNIAGAVMGKRVSDALNDERMITQNAIDEILKYYRVKPREVPDSVQDMNDRLEYLMRPYGIMRREVKLPEGWYRDAVGAMLGVMKEDGRIVALIPDGMYGYRYYDYAAGTCRRVNRKNQSLFGEDAIAFYKPFPLGKVGIWELLKYIAQTLSPSNYVMAALSALIVALLGLFLPKLNSMIFSTVIPSGSMRLVYAMAVFLVCVSVSSLIFDIIRQLVLSRITIRMDVSVRAATMMRILSLPADFFKE